MSRDSLAILMALVITVAWGGSLFYDAVRPAYDPPEWIHPAMMLAAGWAFGMGVFEKGKNGRNGNGR
jgi:hypothetical protein